MVKIVFRSVLVISGLVLVALIGGLRYRSVRQNRNVKALAPDFVLSDSKGATVKLSNLKGNVGLLDFWATYCDVCKVEIPWYVEFQNRYRKDGLFVAGLSVDEDGWKSVKSFLTEQKVTYISVVLGDWDLAARFGVTAERGLPVTFLIDRSGKIADAHVGMVNKDAFEREIQTLLNGPSK